MDGLRRPLYLTRPPEWDTKAKRPKAKPKAKAKAKAKAASEAAAEAGGPDPSVNVVASAVEGCDRRRRTGAVARESRVEGRRGRRPPCSVQDCIFHFLYIRCSAIFGVSFATTFFDLLGPLP